MRLAVYAAGLRAFGDDKTTKALTVCPPFPGLTAHQRDRLTAVRARLRATKQQGSTPALVAAMAAPLGPAYVQIDSATGATVVLAGKPSDDRAARCMLWGLVWAFLRDLRLSKGYHRHGACTDAIRKTLSYYRVEGASSSATSCCVYRLVLPGFTADTIVWTAKAQSRSDVRGLSPARPLPRARPIARSASRGRKPTCSASAPPRRPHARRGREPGRGRWRRPRRPSRGQATPRSRPC
jgi:hypothetical protein